MSRAYERNGSPPIPDYYNASINNPESWGASQSVESFAHDLRNTWLTSSEWLSFLRRSGCDRRILMLGKWRRPLRPFIDCTSNSTEKLRHLP